MLTFRQRLEILANREKEKLFNLNIFKDAQSNVQHHLGTQVLATRFFIGLLGISMFFFVLYSSLTVVTETVTVNKPLLDRYLKLEEKYQPTIVCPCSSVSNEYQQFSSIRPTLHQICASNIIQTDWLTDKVAIVSDNHNQYAIYSFQYLSQWLSVLTSFCQLSFTTIHDQLLLFNSTRFVTQNLLSETLFRTQMDEFISLFQLTVQISFNLSLSMIDQTTMANQLYTGFALVGDFLVLRDNLSSELYPETTMQNTDDGGYCFCKYNVSCRATFQLFSCPIDCGQSYLSINIPYFYFACYPTYGLLMSTLECFYTESCLTTITNFILNATNLTSDVSVLNGSSNSRYSPNTTVGEMLGELLIEQWNSAISYENYYRACQPEKCIYSYSRRNDLIYVVTMTIGFLGGLATILKFLLVPVVSFVRRPEISFNRLLTSLKTLNIFVDVNKTTEHDLQYQYTNTRIFILLQFISFCILVLYTSLSDLTITMTIKKPTSIYFTQLYEQYQQTLNCPCSNISLSYEKFISFNPTYHQVCQSDFVKADWYEYFGYAASTGLSDVTEEGTNYYFRTMIDDYRQTSGVAFQYLSTLCQITSQLVQKKLETFNLTKFLSLRVTSQQLFETQATGFIRAVETETVNSFRRTHSLIRNLTHGNQLLSLWLTNAILNLDVPDDGIYENDGNLTDDGVLLAASGRLSLVYPHRVYNETCDCTQSQFCIQKASIYDLNTTTIVHPIGSMYPYLLAWLTEIESINAGI